VPTAAAVPQENSRERILEATWRLLEDSPDLNVRIADIAAEAGVSRQAVYLHFGDRSKLLLEALRHRDGTAPQKAFVQAAFHDPVPEALGRFVKGWFDYIPRIQPVARIVAAAAQVDEDARVAWEDRMASFRNLVEALARRLAQAGLLQKGWTEAKAADWIWHRTHLDSWRHLVHERGWDPALCARRVAESLERDLLK
jgi:AcrR family transcriptional regulator